MKKLVNLSLNYPKQVIAFILAFTALMGFLIYSNFAIETNPSKSFSRDLDVVKFHNLTLKKFAMKDMILIGIENEEDGVFNIETLRYIESVIDRIKNLKIKKEYDSIISGKTEQIEVPAEIHNDGIMSMINVDDVNVDKNTNTLIVGNLTSKVREKAGLITDDDIQMKRLPQKDSDLRKLIPYYKIELRGNELLKGTLLSVDEKACAIVVPTEKTLENKIDILRRELYTMIDSDRLKDKFNGNDYFPHEIYNKKIDGILIDDKFIESSVKENKQNLKKFFISFFKIIKKDFKDKYEYLQKQEVNEAYIDHVFKIVETDGIYEIENNSLSYRDMVDEIYSFTIANLDQFSLDNLETRVHSIKDIYDVGLLYDLLSDIVEVDRPENIKTYIAGRPVAEALIERFVLNDMSVFLGVTVFVIVIILLFSFRTVRGVILPLAAVGISTIWVMSFLLLAGWKISSGTIPLPTILIAVGSAYIIHYISKFFEETIENGEQNIKLAIQKATDKVQVAINLAAITTICAFLSVIYSAGVIDVKVLGILTSIGIVVTVLLTYSFVPAMLMMMKVPEPRLQSKPGELMTSGLLKLGELTNKHSKFVFFIALILAGIALMGIFKLKTESSITYFFREDNPIRVSSKFIDQKLTGTGQMTIVFKMRDKVNLKSDVAQKDLINRIDSYLDTYDKLLAAHPDLKKASVINYYFTNEITKICSSVADNRDILESKIAVFADIMNDLYEVKAKRKSDKKEEQKDSGDAFDITALSDSSALALDNSSNAPSAAELGINDIIDRIGIINSDNETRLSKDFITKIRKYKNTELGKEFQGKFNHLADFFQTDIKQPVTLNKIDQLGKELKNLQYPKAYIDGVPNKPVGNILSIADTLKVVYKVFYHNGNPKFNKIPDVKADGITDKTLTDRSVIGVCINQFSGSNPDVFKSMLTDDLKLMQFTVFMRSDKADFLKDFNDIFYKKSRKLFPDNDPYVENIVISGLPAINMTMNRMLLDQQLSSILITIAVVFIVCFFIFRSFTGGMLSVIPITLTVVINLGIMGWFDFPINFGTVIIASIAIGAGIDFTIHFIERFKTEHIENKLPFEEAYFNTLKSTGRAIMVSALAVAGGFLVLTLSTFKMLAISGLMVAMSMILSSIASITVLPALINWIDPDFVEEKKSLLARIKDKVFQ